MISVIGRDGLAASVSLTYKRSSPLFTTQARPLSYAVVLNHRVHRYGPQARPGFRYAHSVRRYSTSIPPTEKTKMTAEAVPPVGPRSKKPKVELRPAPVRPKSVAPTSPAQKSSTNTAATEAPTRAGPSSGSASAHGEEGVIDAAKHDVEDAAQHGILKPPPENANKIMKLFHQAKELFKFYVRGLKLINTNRKRAKAMRERVNAGRSPLTRWETRFIRTYQEDALKLIPFALIIIVAEEVIPLVVMYAPFILPSTCILPTQKERISTKKREKRAAYAAELSEAFRDIARAGLTDPSADTKSLLVGPGLTAIGGILGHSSYGLEGMRLRKIQRHLQQIAEDDVLLSKEDMGKALADAEVREALEERGIITNHLTPIQLQSRLHWWLTQVSQESQSADPIARRVVLVARSAANVF